jgi:4-amino-4-deoxy-L-arabinose transferase-like glycosyltransferase
MQQPTSYESGRIVGLTEHPFAWMILIGLVLGIGYAASPLTVLFLGSVVVLFSWARRGLSVRERQWVLGLLLFAIAARLLLVALLFLTTDPFETKSFFWDGDGVYLKQRAEWIRNIWLGNQIAPLDYDRAFYRGYGWTTYIYVIAYVQYLVGESPYGIHLLNVFLSLSVAVVLYRLIRTAYGKTAAVIGLSLSLFMPTPLLWSVSALKESLYVFLIMLGLVGTVAVVRGPNITRRILGLCAVIISFTTIGGVRGGGEIVLGAGVAGGLFGVIATRRLWVAALAFALLPFMAYRLIQSEVVYSRLQSQLQIAAVQHIGHVKTEGNAYKLLDERFYVDTAREVMVASWTPSEQLRYVVRATASLIAVPLPWQVRSATEILFLPQQIVWYLVVLMAGIGSISGVRRDPLVTFLLVSTVIVSSMAVALTSGNIGTMVRHRDTVTPFIVWLSAGGVVATVSSWKSLTARRVHI